MNALDTEEKLEMVKDDPVQIRLIKQSSNQSINPSSNQPTKQPTNQSINQSITNTKTFTIHSPTDTEDDTPLIVAETDTWDDAGGVRYVKVRLEPLDGVMEPNKPKELLVESGVK